MADQEKEGYWTPLEKWCRDYLLWPLTRPLGIIPQAANLLTIAGFFILLTAVRDFYYYRSLERQIWFLIAAWLTDFFDGPIARNNDSVTAFGTAADHTRDYLLGFWMIFLSLYFTPLSGNFSILMRWIFLLSLLGSFGIILGVWLYLREKRQERKEQFYFEFLNEFLLKDLVTSATARGYTFVFAVGDIFYIAGIFWNSDFYKITGSVMLASHLIILGFYSHEVWRQKYEDRVYKIRKALQTAIKDPEEMLQRIKEWIKE